MTKTPESFVPLAPNKRLNRYIAGSLGAAMALAMVGCGTEKGASSSNKKTSYSANPHNSEPAAPVQSPVSELPTSSASASESSPAQPEDTDAFATRRVCDAIYVADKGARVILRPVVNQKNQVLDIADQTAGGVDFMPDPLTANDTEWFQLNGQPFTEGKEPSCKDQELFMNAVLQPNGFTTWQMSSVNHQLGTEPTRMPWDPNAIRGSFDGVHFDEGKLSCTALLGVVPGYDPSKC